MNPYESPGGPGPDSLSSDPSRKTIFTLAAIGSGLAALYWAALTALIGLAAATNDKVSGTQIILPCVLIGLYALRAFQIWKGDPNAARRVLWLHVVGGAVAVFQMTSGASLVIILNVIKVAIHVFGGITAYRASKA
jgi:hypothetical protein